MGITPPPMKLFKTSGADYINLDQVTRFVCDPHQVTLHFDGENQLTLRDDDAKKITRFIAESVGEAVSRVPTH